MPTQFEKMVGKQIVAANKICDSWKKASERYASDFEDIRKKVLPIKRLLNGIQRDVNNDAHLVAGADELIAQCTQHKATLETQLKLGEKLNKAHNDWALKEPRKSMAFIRKKLKLGKPDEPVYQAVTEGIGNQLTIVSNVLQKTEKLWGRDVKIMVENQIERADTLIKILTGADNKRDAFLKGLGKRVDRFLSFCGSIERSLMKIDAMSVNLRDRDFPGSMNETALKQNIKLNAERIKNFQRVPKTMDKNFDRVVANLPNKMRGTRDVVRIVGPAIEKAEEMKDQLAEGIAVLEEWLTRAAEDDRV